MTTSSIVTPTEVFKIIDSTDPQRFADLLTPDASLTFANNPPMVGTDAIVAGCGYFYGTIKALRHSIRNEWRGRASPETAAWTSLAWASWMARRPSDSSFMMPPRQNGRQARPSC